jgi:hypothetical protein
MPKTRAEIEAQRGIVRDDDGRILRTKEWLEQRVAYLKERDADLDRRKKNIKVEIAQRTKELSGLE